jgi:rhodanese-related sulfurtransferase
MIRTATALAAALFLLPACGADEAARTPEVAVVDAPAKTMTAPAEDGLVEMSMDDVEKKMASGDCTVVDANSASTRETNGVLEGAILIDNYRTFDFANLDVSKDSSVVFYCGSTMCTASDKAATRATAAGFTDVKVMREGIKGWKKAGKNTVEWSAPAETEKSAS